MVEMVMRVAYVSQFSEIIGGGEHSLMELIGHLPASIQPELVVPVPGALSRWAETEGMPVHFLPMPKIGVATFAALWKWRKWVKAEGFDIIHANQSRAAFYTGLAATDARVVFHCRIAEKDGLMDSILMRLSDAIICNSCAVAARFEGFSGKLQVIYNGVVVKQAADESAVSLPDDGRLILFVGRISTEKQPQSALQVFEQLAGKFENLHFAMVGGDDPQDPGFSMAFREAVRKSVFGERIYLPGAVDSVASWYRQADLFILTSRHEGFGRVLVEAMAEGAVPVAFSVGGVPEVLVDGEQGFLVASDDISAMGQCVEKLLHDEKLRSRMAENGRVRASLFSVDVHVVAIEKFYKEVLNDG